MTAKLITRFGPGVRAWIDTLPALVDTFAARWNLAPVRELTGGGTSHALLCRRAGDAVVLKLTPDPEIARQELDALRAWEPSPRMVRVLESDVDSGALLLEGLEPGTPATYDPQRMVELVQALHLPPRGDFPTLARRVDFVFELLARRRPGDYTAGHAAAAALARDRVPATLLHGDLHLDNVLDAGERGLVAIDPRPCLGDPASDAVDFAYSAPDLRSGIDALSGAVDGDRLAAWCVAYADFFPDRRAEALSLG
ncbi:aminoglycoside phosphotransferase family protein [Saccharothrix variisporea]|uniref:Streptomycin 6-kinase n=1 Tax=Saccharothrix variisporea TaxID=543527 RepID=A0A495X746_9PSEU|nr:aminoglycoside phosphotransferase family protein [Saccharothrix variisporea]RKT67338.1 streptomycin 6-kinase [Saccharothrix variisporea]